MKTISSRKAVFLDRLATVDQEMERHSIPYRVIGSVGMAAHGIMPLKFERDSPDPLEQVPDIDLVVPRQDLKGARAIRENILRSSFPVKVGLAIPTLQIDMRPSENYAYLTNGHLSIPINEHVFDAQRRVYEGVAFDTVSVDALRHIYGQMTPPRDKDIGKRQAFDDKLGADLHMPSDPYVSFHEYQKLMKQRKSLERHVVDTASYAIGKLPSRQAARAHRLGLRAASFLNWR